MDKSLPRGSKAVVLVVEDNYLLQMDAAETIREAGFEVVEANNADEAISVLQERQDIRLVFTDIEMPGSLDGLKLAHAIRERWPPIGIILTSGHHQISADRLPARCRFIPKPYEPAKMISTVRELAAA
jgi:CheY-like chemotaxis protein